MASTTGDFTVAATPGDQVPYALVGPDGEPVEPVQDYLAELLAADCSPLTLRSYAFDLLDWFRFLAAAGVGWQHATRALVRDWVLGLRGRDAAAHPGDTASDKPPPTAEAEGTDGVEGQVEVGSSVCQGADVNGFGRVPRARRRAAGPGSAPATRPAA
jgi:Phage integrase, N-terminal SAM-like domain